MTRWLLVRADGGSQVGLGHVMRCMAVADELARIGVRTAFLSRALPHWVSEELRIRGHAGHVLDLPVDASEEQDANATAACAAGIRATHVLLDHYGLGTRWTGTFRKESDVRIAAIDDLAAETRDVDLLIDPSPGRRAGEYRGLVPEEATILTGANYAALRPEFALIRDTEQGQGAPVGPCRVMISMGGVDPDGASISCLDALDGQDNIALTVVLGSAAPKLADTKARVARMQTPTRLLLDRRDMAALIAESDLVVGAGGTSALERCALGRASVLAILADNQVNNASQLEAAGAVALIPELTPNAIRATVSPLLQNETARAARGAAAASVCDGWGAPRVAAALCAFKTGVALRPVDRDDMEFVHRLQSEPGARRFARTPTVPPVEDHKRWFAVRLQNIADDPFHIVTLKGSRCGFVRIDRRDGAPCWEVSILISERVQGQGVGHTSLGLLRLTYPTHDISAHVHPDNTASQRLFENAGYERRSEDSFFSPGWARIEQRRCHAD